MVLAYFNYNSIFAATGKMQPTEVEKEIIQKLDSILAKQSTILLRLDDVEREIKNRCK